MLAACGTTVVTRPSGPLAAPIGEPTSPGVKPTAGGLQPPNLSGLGPKLDTGSAGDPKCATNSNQAHGFTESTIKWGTIIPLTGALRPFGEQTARVMRASVNYLNTITSFAGSFDWGCSLRPGIYGRKVELKILSLNQNTQDEAAAAMRRLIDVENVFLVRDCYLQPNIMGPATDYQNRKRVPGIWCFSSGQPYPELAPYNFAPGTDPLKTAAVHAGYLMNTLGRKRLAVLADPAMEDNGVRIVKQIYRHLTGREMPDRCVGYTRTQDAPTGMQSEIQQIRNCYQDEDPSNPSPNAVLALFAFQGVFGALSAQNAGWSTDPAQVQWACATCWVDTLADLCRDACRGMLTDCQALPCIPWSDLPGAKALREVKKRFLPGEPEDVLTYGPLAITTGLGIWLGMTGPDLSREKLVRTVGNLRNWDAGIGPIINTGPNDRFGGRALWLITFNGNGFSDRTKGFLTLDDVKIPDSLTR